MLREHAGEALPIAGGTALEVLRRLGLLGSPPLVDLSRLPELRGIERRGDEARLGACVTLREVVRAPEIAAGLSLLAQTCSRVGNPRVRNQATLGGNLAYADHRIDAPAALLALGARVRLRSAEDTREVPLRGFFWGLERTELAPDELLTEVLVPLPPPGSLGCFRRMVGLAENVWPCAGVAVLRRPGAGGDTLQVGLSALAPTPRHLEVEVGGLSLAQAQERADEAAAGMMDPVGDLGGSPAFKRRLGRVALREAVEAVWAP
jgi:carbon-monoxide dehydrogenase medium subunit